MYINYWPELYIFMLSSKLAVETLFSPVNVLLCLFGHLQSAQPECIHVYEDANNWNFTSSADVGHCSKCAPLVLCSRLLSGCEPL